MHPHPRAQVACAQDVVYFARHQQILELGRQISGPVWHVHVAYAQNKHHAQVMPSFISDHSSPKCLKAAVLNVSVQAGDDLEQACRGGSLQPLGCCAPGEVSGRVQLGLLQQVGHCPPALSECGIASHRVSTAAADETGSALRQVEVTRRARDCQAAREAALWARCWA